MSQFKASDRQMQVWYNKIQLGEIKLPRFQRYEAWDRNRIKSLLNNLVSNLPLGAALILEVGDEEKFISRYMSHAVPKNPEKVKEQLLDGQQRLTAIWRALHNSYKYEDYLLYLKEYDTTEKEPDSEEEDDSFIHVQSRWFKKDKKNNGTLKYPLWVDSPEDCLKRGYIPFELLKPEDISSKINGWIKKATDYKKPNKGSKNFEDEYDSFNQFKNELEKKVNSFREVVKYYNMPFLSLPPQTSKGTALKVFIDMNTNSKPLSQFDIIVAEIESVSSKSLHDLQTSLDEEIPQLKNYFDLSYLLLYTSALIQDKLPNRRGIWEINANKLLVNWPKLKSGLLKMSEFLYQFHIYDEQRLPTSNVLAVIAALFTHEPIHTDEKGIFLKILRKYLWYSFFTDRYENSAASRAYADYMAIKKVIQKEKKENSTSIYTEKDIPIFNEKDYPFATEENLLNVNWPKQVNIRARAILAVANYFNARDFASGESINVKNIKDREYHHIFPDDLIENAKKHHEDLEASVALNCALIIGQTNRRISAKAPLQYLKERYKWTDENTIRERLDSHLIPFDELAKDEYNSSDEKKNADKIKKDFHTFLLKRAAIIISASKLLATKESVSFESVMKNIEQR